MPGETVEGRRPLSKDPRNLDNINRMSTTSGWRQRESDLIWGTPLVLFPALAIVPVTVSLLIDPFFHHARILGVALIPILGLSMAVGLSRLAACFRRDFDVITLFAGGIVVVLIVICMGAGVVLASVITADVKAGPVSLL
jgi:hypothetical protein